MIAKGRVVGLIIGTAVIGVMAAVWACSSKNNPASPSGGGGPELSSGPVPPGGVYQHVFATAGAFAYHCTIHAAMTGNSVTVSAGGMNDSAFVQIVSSTAPGFSPSSVTIKPGGHVRWINADTVTHTVTSGS